MPVRWEVDVDRQLLSVDIVGAWMDDHESQQLRDALVPRGAWLVTRVILDLRLVDPATVPSAAILSERLRVWRDLATTPPAIALVGAPGPTFDVARLVEQLSTGLPIASFANEASALAWLLGDDETLPPNR